MSNGLDIPSSDNHQTILMLLTEIKADLRHALGELAKHSESIEVLRSKAEVVDGRLIALETSDKTAGLRDRVSALERKVWAWSGASVLVSAVITGGGLALVSSK